MKTALLILFFYIFSSTSLSGQYIVKSWGFTGGVINSAYTSLELGYSFIRGGYYKVNDEYPIKSKNFYHIIESQLGYAPTGNFSTLRISNSIAFEVRRWNNIFIGFNCGIDLALQSNLKINEYQVNPKVAITLFHGTAEFAYSRNLLDNKMRYFSNANTFSFILRPYIFVKSQREKWTK